MASTVVNRANLRSPVARQPACTSSLVARSSRLHADSHQRDDATTSAQRSASTVLSLADVTRTLSPGDLQALQRDLRQRAASLWASYAGELSARPLRTKALTSMVGLALGDLIAQAGTGCFDPMRTARMATFGLLLHGTSGHYWYQLLDAKVMPQRSSSTAAIVTKMLLDQIIFSPICTTVFYAALTAMEGRPGDIAEVVATRVMPTVVTGYALWPIAHLVSFKFVPSNYRLLYINAISLIWTVQLSKMASAPMPGDVVCAAPTPDGGAANSSPYAVIPVSNLVDGAFIPSEESIRLV